jgi:hypothetical protein
LANANRYFPILVAIGLLVHAVSMAAGNLTILYHHPQRPDEGRMTLISDQEGGAATVERLEKRGFVVDKITYDPFATSRPLSDAAD